MKTYLVIGASGSIGSKVTELLKNNNHQIIAGTSKKPKSTNENTLYLDLTDNASISKLSEFTKPLDGIIFAAGYEPKQSLLEMSLEHQNKMLQIHVAGPLNVVKALLKNLKEHSAIVFISSIAAYKGSYDPMYATAKGAVLSLCRTLAVELSKYKIRVNCIAPGLVEGTPVFNGMTSDFREKHINNTLDKKLATTDDCVNAIYFLLTQEHITGQVIHINGGHYFGT
ncbi:MAG TPA: SDR family oxidoreductase [Bacteroidia bacterium]